MQRSDESLHRLTGFDTALLQCNIHSLALALGECIENSIDAGSTSIEAKVNQSSISFTIKDNGRGIGRKDLETIGTNSWSSKYVNGAEDTQTYGFKGLGLFSICAVSNVTITSKTAHDDCPYTVSLVGSQRTQSQKVQAESYGITPMRSGTVVKVSQMFYNIRVRRLQNTTLKPAEFSRLLHNLLCDYALVHPEVSIRIIEDPTKKVHKLNVNRGSDMLSVASSIFGKGAMEEYACFVDKDGDMSIEGIYGKSKTYLRNRRLVYVNNRRLEDKKILGLLESLKPNYWPGSALFYLIRIRCKLTSSDSLQDPRKRILSFSRSSEVCTLLNHTLTERIKKIAKSRALRKDVQHFDNTIRKSLRRHTSLPKLRISGQLKVSEYFSHYDSVILDQSTLKSLHVVSQIDKKYILVKSDSAKPLLLILDQHACDERVRVESLFRNYFAEVAINTNNSFNYLGVELRDTISVELGSDEIEVIQNYKENFRAWGIDFVTDPKSGTLSVTKAPEIMEGKYSESLKELLVLHSVDLLSQRKRADLQNLSCEVWWEWLAYIPDILKDIIISKACRSAIMFGDPLSLRQCEDLIHNLSFCKFASQCAHGRPSFLPLGSL